MSERTSYLFYVTDRRSKRQHAYTILQGPLDGKFFIRKGKKRYLTKTEWQQVIGSQQPQPKQTSPVTDNVSDVLRDLSDAAEKKGVEFDLKDYELKQVYGEGYFGQVSLFVNKTTNETIVIKRMSKENVSREEVVNEVNILELLRPNCETYILCAAEPDFYEDVGNFYIATEDLGTFSLLEKMLGTPAFANQAVTRKIALCEELKRGLMEIHNHDVVHRDIKPANIMAHISDDGEVRCKYIDFGLAVHNSSSNNGFSTVAFKSPELMAYGEEGKTPLTMEDMRKMDYWALGMTILMMLLNYSKDILIFLEAKQNLKWKTVKASMEKNGMTAKKWDIVNESLAPELKPYLEQIKPLLEFDPANRQLIIQ